MTRRLTISLLLALGCALGLSACGNKGDLVHPDSPKADRSSQ